ncbi:hypothetical protein GCM10009664_54650 [Kitasatospora gansuensis]
MGPFAVIREVTRTTALQALSLVSDPEFTLSSQLSRLAPQCLTWTAACQSLKAERWRGRQAQRACGR